MKKIYYTIIVIKSCEIGPLLIILIIVIIHDSIEVIVGRFPNWLRQQFLVLFC